jgi:ferredoxin-NADP reductase
MKLRYTHKRQEIDNVWSFFFTPEEPVAWTAGQSIRLELPRETFGVSERRFTIASAPLEEHIRITTRVGGSRFKHLLDAMRPDTVINAHNIDGDFTWGDAHQHRIFVAGGIGITPYRAMIAERRGAGQPLDAMVLYGSRDRPAVFSDELDEWQSRDPTFAVTYLYDTRVTVSHMTGLTGWQDALIYLSGPSMMVEILYQELLLAGARQEQLKADLFTGDLSV